jgi:hypothetical protein
MLIEEFCSVLAPAFIQPAIDHELATKTSILLACEFNMDNTVAYWKCQLQIRLLAVYQNTRPLDNGV